MFFFPQTLFLAFPKPKSFLKQQKYDKKNITNLAVPPAGVGDVMMHMQLY